MTVRSRVLCDAAAKGRGVNDFAAIYRDHAPQVARWLRKLGGPSLDVEDALQEVFLTAHKKLPGFRGEAEISTWLYRIASNEVSHRRRKDRWRRLLIGKGERVDRPALAPTPLEAVERRERQHLLYRILDGIPEKYRNLLILFELEEMSGDAIASLTCTKVSTVWVQLHRARALFLKRMADLDQEDAR